MERKKVFVTILLIIINVAVFIILELLGDTQSTIFMIEHGGMLPTLVYEGGEAWRLISATFLHFGFRHLLNNMVILAASGPILERAIGWWRFLLLYLLSGVGGCVVSLLEMSYTQDYAVAAGASGSIFGVIGGLLWVVIRNRGKYEGLTTKRMLVMIVLCLLYGILSSGVDNWGHFGGLAIGFFTCLILYRSKGKKIDFTDKNQYT